MELAETALAEVPVEVAAPELLERRVAHDEAADHAAFAARVVGHLDWRRRAGKRARRRPAGHGIDGAPLAGVPAEVAPRARTRRAGHEVDLLEAVLAHVA